MGRSELQNDEATKGVESIMGEIRLEIPALPDLCPYCLGSGKLKAMQSVAFVGGGSARGKDTTVKCKHCKGTGYKQ